MPSFAFSWSFDDALINHEGHSAAATKPFLPHIRFLSAGSRPQRNTKEIQSQDFPALSALSAAKINCHRDFHLRRMVVDKTTGYSYRSLCMWGNNYLYKSFIVNRLTQNPGMGHCEIYLAKFR